MPLFAHIKAGWLAIAVPLMTWSLFFLCQEGHSETAPEVISPIPALENSSPSDSRTVRVRSKKNAADNHIISKICIEGNRMILEDKIRAVIKTEVGEAFDQKAVDRDLYSITELGFFDRRRSSVSVVFLKKGVILTFRVAENSPVTQFVFEGNNLLPDDELQQFFFGPTGGSAKPRTALTRY
jgi:outer membrane protein assembly factor BamA